jgi:predicted kinase
VDDEIELPPVGLILLMGVAASGKSAFAARWFLRFEVVSSDACRGMVSDDEADQGATPDAFDLLRFIVSKRLARRRLTVVDATNVRKSARERLLDLARAYDTEAVAIVLDLPVEVCVLRDQQRAVRRVGRAVILEQHRLLALAMEQLSDEGFVAATR